jgi:hypothetical protein
MRAICWHGKRDVRVDTVPDPQILHRHDAIVRVTTTAICGSDLHLYNNNIPAGAAGLSVSLLFRVHISWERAVSLLLIVFLSDSVWQKSTDTRKLSILRRRRTSLR